MPNASLSQVQLDALREFDTCTLANAIETFDVRLRNQGFTRPELHCLFPEADPTLGYAITATVKCSNPPMSGGAYMDRTDWWSMASDQPIPRVIVIQDIDERPGTGAVTGEIHSTIWQKLGCTGIVTNGAVRDVPALRSLGFGAFATGISVSHGYIHGVDFGIPVEICGLAVCPGDLLYGDGHGVLSIPLAIAGELPAVAARMVAHERKIIDLCRSPDFDLTRLKKEVQILD
jgi:4-hydroxy-4-methyl-2-oxoglutarate aldolase